jgi:hypothetical protein
MSEQIDMSTDATIRCDIHTANTFGTAAYSAIRPQIYLLIAVANR